MGYTKNLIRRGDRYPQAGFNSATAATAGARTTQAGQAAPAETNAALASNEAAQAAIKGSTGNSAMGWLTFFIALLVFMFVAPRLAGDSEKFANIKLTLFNVIVIALAAKLGSIFLKLIFTKVKLPGVSDWMVTG